MMRWRRSIRSVGSDPDYRFTLANERTFLAWLRTALALVAGAVALATLVPELGPVLVRNAVTFALLALGLTLTVGAYLRWDRAERALRENRPLPIGVLPGLVAAGVTVIVVGIAVLVVLVAGGGQ
jgi:inner membrane protein YidH